MLALHISGTSDRPRIDTRLLTRGSAFMRASARPRGSGLSGSRLASGYPVDDTEDNEVTDREKLKREIYTFGMINDASVSTLKSKTMSDDDRVALMRQIAIRTAHQKLLQQRLKRLSLPGTLSAY
jgi:hypothetical protein